MDEVEVCLSEYPELLKACTLADAVVSMPSELCQCENCQYDQLDCRSTTCHLLPVIDQGEVCITDGSTTVKPLPQQDVDVTAKCLAWIQKCSDMDFFRTFPDVALLYSPYSAVTFTEYTDGGPGFDRPVISLYPGGATVPEHCLTWSSRVVAETSDDWLMNVDGGYSVPCADSRPKQTDPCMVPTNCSSEVFHATTRYSNRPLKPELVPSDLSSGTSYHRVSVKPYASLYPKSGSALTKQAAFVDPGGRTTPGVGTSIGKVPNLDVPGIIEDVITSAAVSVMEADDDIERPDSAMSLIRPASSLADYDALCRPDSGLSNGEHSMRPGSSLSQYNNSTYGGSVLDHSLRPDSALSHFSEFDSGIDEFRSHSTTPPLPGDERQTVIGRKNNTSITDSKQVKHVADPSDENHVTSTSDDISDGIDNDDTEAEEVGRDVDSESVVSGSTCSSGQLMIDTNDDESADEDLTCKLNSSLDSDPEQDQELLCTATQHVDPTSLTSDDPITVSPKLSSRCRRTSVESGKQSNGLITSLSAVAASVTLPSTDNKQLLPQAGGRILPSVMTNPIGLKYMSSDQPSGYMYSAASSGAIPNPINMGYVPTAASTGCVPSHSSMAGWHGTGMHDAARWAHIPGALYAINPGQMPSASSPQPGAYPYYPPMWNYYPGGMHPYISPTAASPYVNYMSWVMGYPGYCHPHIPYAGTSPLRYMMAPPSSRPLPMTNSDNNICKSTSYAGKPGQLHFTPSTSCEHSDILNNEPASSGKRKRDHEAISSAKRQHTSLTVTSSALNKPLDDNIM